MPRMKELPKNERPREKLFMDGSASLSNTELIAILIGTGSDTESAMELAARVLSIGEGGLIQLSLAAPEELSGLHGIGAAKACRIAAASELGRRFVAQNSAGKQKITAPADIAVIFMEEMRREKKEFFSILMLNARNEVVGRETISIGNISSAIVDPRDVFRPAVKKGAASVVLVHNHPSGNPDPSAADILLTTRLTESGKLLEIKVMDHVIIGDGKYVSMKNMKLM